MVIVCGSGWEVDGCSGVVVQVLKIVSSLVRESTYVFPSGVFRSWVLRSLMSFIDASVTVSYGVGPGIAAFGKKSTVSDILSLRVDGI